MHTNIEAAVLSVKDKQQKILRFERVVFALAAHILKLERLIKLEKDRYSIHQEPRLGQAGAGSFFWVSHAGRGSSIWAILCCCLGWVRRELELISWDLN